MPSLDKSSHGLWPGELKRTKGQTNDLQTITQNTPDLATQTQKLRFNPGAPEG